MGSRYKYIVDVLRTVFHSIASVDTSTACPTVYSKAYYRNGLYQSQWRRAKIEKTGAIKGVTALTMETAQCDPEQIIQPLLTSPTLESLASLFIERLSDPPCLHAQLSPSARLAFVD